MAFTSWMVSGYYQHTNNVNGSPVDEYHGTHIYARRVNLIDGFHETSVEHNVVIVLRHIITIFVVPGVMYVTLLFPRLIVICRANACIG